jgi:hypothetical protein
MLLIEELGELKLISLAKKGKSVEAPQLLKTPW